MALRFKTILRNDVRKVMKERTEVYDIATTGGASLGDTSVHVAGPLEKVKLSTQDHIEN